MKFHFDFSLEFFSALKRAPNKIVFGKLIRCGVFASLALAASSVSAVTPLITAGGWQSCAVDSGSVACWSGYNNGQFSALDSVNEKSISSGVTSISAGAQRTCAITSAGAVMCWTQWAPAPVQVTGITGLSNNSHAIASGYEHTCALTSASAVMCWGNNSFGQLGNGAAGYDSATPVQVQGLSSGVIALSAGTNHTCALTSSGAVMCWGYGVDGELGTPRAESDIPVQAQGLTSGVVSISSGGRATCAVTSSSTVMCWGASISNVPTIVPNLSGVVAVAVGEATSEPFDSEACALTQSGSVKCWRDSSAVTQVTGLENNVSAIAMNSSDNKCAVLNSGNVMCWGDNGGSMNQIPAPWHGGDLNITHPAGADLSLSMTVGGDTATGLTATGSVTNLGPNTASNTVMQFQLPAGVLYKNGPIGCSASGSAVTCNFGDLGWGEYVDFTITGTVSIAGNYSTSATVSSAINDPQTSNNSIALASTILQSNTDIPTMPEWGMIILGLSFLMVMARNSFKI